MPSNSEYTLNSSANGSPTTAPSISLPKGGGAIRGMGEKFAANPITGTGSMTVPIATSPGRSGFGPQLALSYDSGAGNGTFGFGWNLSLASITRKTDKGLPRYLDADESDVFILSGAEDLVLVLVQDAHGGWQPEALPPRAVDGRWYRIRRYRPRIEGLFARIERWTNQADPGDSFWRSISRDNITTFYGKTAESRIFDPAEPARIFSWLICQSHDYKGNTIVYEYKKENSAGIDLTQTHERNRTGTGRSANRYLERSRVAIYRNGCGNSSAAADYLSSIPAVDDLASVTAVDLLSNGTACLVWSSPLPGAAENALRYIDLKGGQKSYLLVKSVNNLGAETHVHYASSTKFYLADKLAGRPWINRNLDINISLLT